MAGIGAVLLALALVGCGNAGLTTGGSSISTFTVTMSDGRSVECVAVGGSSVTCDWEGASRGR